MNEDQAVTILKKVQWDWSVETRELLDDNPADLARELKMFPVEGVTIDDLLAAIERLRSDLQVPEGVSLDQLEQALEQVGRNPRWAE